MLIGNLRSNADLVNKRDLQAQLLQLEVQNEAELEKRVKDFKNPNKPLPVAPEYRTNAELQKDRLKQEQQAISNMEDLGFDYNKSAEMVAWLSSSLINKLVEFNANFKGIKKELVDTTNPKLLSLDFIKNYLEKYFEDLDINFGRKMGRQDINGTLAPASIDDLDRYLPDVETLLAIRDDLVDILNGNPYGIIPANEPNGYTLALQMKIERLIALLNVYIAVIPSKQSLNVIKASLTQQERSDLVRRYILVLKDLRILTADGADELLDEIEQIGRHEISIIDRFVNKATKALAFLSNESGISKLSKLERDYEVVASQNGKIGDVDALKIVREARDREEQEARKGLERVLEDIAKFNRGQLAPVAFVDNPSLSDDVREKRFADYYRQLEEEVEEEERQQRLAKFAGIKDVELRPTIPPPSNVDVGEMFRQRDAIKQQVIETQQNFAGELVEKFQDDPIGGIATVRNFLKDVEGIPLKETTDRKLGVRTEQEWFDVLMNAVERFAQQKLERLERENTGLKLLDYDIIKETNRATLYNDKNRTKRQTQYGIGMREGIRKDLHHHMKEDEKYEKQIAKSLKGIQQKMEDSSSDEEDMGRRRVQIPERNLGFKHKKIKVGGGIARAERPPTYAQFGKYVIHIPHLMERNVANFKYPSLGSIPSIKAQTISEDYKQFLIDTLQNKKPNERLLSKLLPDEQRHFERVVVGAGLLEEFKLKRDPSDKDKKDSDRFQLLRGEVMAGNNSEKVLKELRGLIVRFMNEDRITKKEGTSMLMELSAL